AQPDGRHLHHAAEPPHHQARLYRRNPRRWSVRRGVEDVGPRPWRSLVAISRRLARPHRRLGQAEMRQLQHRHQSVRRLSILSMRLREAQSLPPHAGGSMMRVLRQGLLSLVIMISVALLGVSTVQAQDLEQALAGFTADNFADTDSAIGAVAKTGSPRAIELI